MSSCNGFIKDYAVTLKVNGSPRDILSNERVGVIDDLSPGTEYSVQVASCMYFSWSWQVKRSVYYSSIRMAHNHK